MLDSAEEVGARFRHSVSKIRLFRSKDEYYAVRNTQETPNPTWDQGRLPGGGITNEGRDKGLPSQT